MKKTIISRRTFVTSITSLAFAPALAGASSPCELREQFQLDHRVPVLMIVSAHPTSKSAEKWRREYAVKPFDSTGEWYLGSVIELDLPKSLAEMPGSMAEFNYVAGAAAVESSMIVGAFRRDHIACAYRAHGTPDDVIALAEDFASRTIPDSFELLWNPTRLKLFIPTTERMGMDVSPSDAFWP